MNVTLDSNIVPVRAYVSGANPQLQTKAKSFEITAFRITAVVFLAAAGAVFFGAIPFAASSKLIIGTALALASTFSFALSILRSRNAPSQPLPIAPPPRAAAEQQSTPISTPAPAAVSNVMPAPAPAAPPVPPPSEMPPTAQTATMLPVASMSMPPAVHPAVAEYGRVKCSTAPGALRDFVQNQLNNEESMRAFGESLTASDID